MLCNVFLTFGSVDEILSVTLQIKAIKQYFPVVLFIMLYKVVLTESVNKILSSAFMRYSSLCFTMCF